MELLSKHRRSALEGLPLEALRNGANANGASAEEVMAHVSEIAVRYDAAVAADSMGRMVYLVSDPHLPNKHEVQAFVLALVSEASRSQRSNGHPAFRES